MDRKSEAYLAQNSISLKKIIYVEGILDYKILKTFLAHKNILTTKVVEINIEEDDSHLPVDQRETAKSKIISLIRKLNLSKDVSKKYLGIVDIDYDYHNRNLLEIPYLLYTDFNCIESLFLNHNLINNFLNDYDVSIDSYQFESLLDKSMFFSFYFYFQITKIHNLSNDQKLRFDDISLCNPYFCCEISHRIKIKNILDSKTKDTNDLKDKFFQFLKDIDRQDAYKNRMLLLHGKYTLRYIVCIIKRIFRVLNNLSYETIMINLRDKYFLFHHYASSRMFSSIEKFALD